MVVIWMVWVVIILSTYLIVDNKVNNLSDKVVAKMLDIEYEKVGWKENYEKINEIQKKQITEWLKQYDEQLWVQPSAQPGINSDSATAWSKISIEQAKQITSEWTYILWNSDAEITWVEYSDLECPFCKRLHQSWTIEEVIESYDWKVNFVFKQFPLDFHPQALMESEALLCAWDLAWSDKYYEFVNKIFDNSKVNWNSYTKESISDLGDSIWIDKSKLLSCIESGKFKQRAQDEMAEWQTFGITWTPWNVLINNKTGKWDKLPWAQPTASFKQKIDSLLQ